MGKLEKFFFAILGPYPGIVSVVGLSLSLLGLAPWIIPEVVSRATSAFPYVETWTTIGLLTLAPFGWLIKSSWDFWVFKKGILPSVGWITATSMVSTLMLAICIGVHMDIHTRKIAANASEQTWERFAEQDRMNRELKSKMAETTYYNEQVLDVQLGVIKDSTEVLKVAQEVNTASQEISKAASESLKVAKESLDIVARSSGIDPSTLPKPVEIPAPPKIKKIKPIEVPAITAPQSPRYIPPTPMNPMLYDALVVHEKLFYFPVAFAIASFIIHMQIITRVFTAAGLTYRANGTSDSSTNAQSATAGPMQWPGGRPDLNDGAQGDNRRPRGPSQPVRNAGTTQRRGGRSNTVPTGHEGRHGAENDQNVQRPPGNSQNRRRRRKRQRPRQGDIDALANDQE